MNPPKTDVHTPLNPDADLRIARHFTSGQVHPYDEINWELRTARVGRPGEPPRFQQDGVEVPEFWSQNATDIVAQKYFAYGESDSRRESSVRQLIDRVAGTIATAGLKHGYFADEAEHDIFLEELTYILVHQKAAFNSPVWFNVGVTGARQQCSACFILAIEDSLDAISHWQVEETRIFKRGSGAGVNLSPLRGSVEGLTLGGTSSGPVTFMRAADANAGTIQSGGTCLAPWQPVYTAEGPKTVQELAATNEDFVVLSYDPPAQRYKAKTARAWQSGHKQLVRITTDKGTFELTDDHPVKLSTGEYVAAGDLNAGHSLLSCTTRLDGEGHVIVSLRDGMKGREKMHRLVATDVMNADLSDGQVVHHDDENKFDNTPGNLQVLSSQAEHARLHGLRTAAQGEHIFQKQSFPKIGTENPMHASSDFWQDDEKVARYKDKQRELLNVDRAVQMQTEAARQKMLNSAFVVLNAGHSIDTFDDYVAGRKQAIGRIPSITQLQAKIDTRFGDYESFKQEVAKSNHRVVSVERLGFEDVYDVEVDCPTADDKTPDSGHNFVVWPLGDSSSAGSGIVISNTRRAAKMVVLNIDHPDIEDFIWCKAREEDRIRALQAAGYEIGIGTEVGEKNLAEATAYQNANNSVRLTDDFLEAVEKGGDWNLIGRTDGSIYKTLPARELMRAVSEAAWRCADPGVQYDTTINDWHTTPAQGPITASNPCSEFLSNDNTSCNLASLNLLSFMLPDGSFDIEGFRHTTRIIFTAQDITIAFGEFPTRKITENTRKLRQIGIGYANLGALLMAMGLAYDSDAGRSLAASITALLTGESYLQSTHLAERAGPFEHYEENAKSVQRVWKKHRDATAVLDGVNEDLVKAARSSWNDALKRLRAHGARNAQASVLAPTGCLLPGTLVSTDRGLVRLGNLGDTMGEQWQDIDLQVVTDEGAKQATKFYVNQPESTVRLTTKRGYQLQGTPAHRIKVLDASGEWVWRRLGELHEDDNVPMMLGGMTGEPQLVKLPPLGELSWHAAPGHTAPREMTADLAELVGYFMGDGSLHAKGLRFCVSNGDEDVIARLNELAKTLFGLTPTVEQNQGYQAVCFNSVELVCWWEACGFMKIAPSEHHSGKGYWPHIPNSILHSNDAAAYGAFIRGLFEADGNASLGTANFSSANEAFVHDVQTMLLTLGFPTTLEELKSRDDRFSDKEFWRLRLLNGATSLRFAQEIGFISYRKNSLVLDAERPQAARKDHIPVSRELVEIVSSAGGPVRQTVLQQHARGGTVTRSSGQRLLAQSEGDTLESEELAHRLGFFFDKVGRMELQTELEHTYDLSVPENVTYVANGFVSHNTISFLMDCDTTGVEPDFALVKHKTLAGGGTMTIVNKTVPLALRRLGYTAQQAEDIVAYIGEELDMGTFKAPRNSVIGAPHLDPDHYSVFSTANGDGVQGAIAWRGHLKMMASVQPFISGAISKTVNLPESATIEEIEEVYLEGGRLGLKAVAVYRDNCKAFQPLTSGDKSDRDADAQEAVENRLTSLLGDGLLRGERRKVPRKANMKGIHFEVGMTSGYISVREFEDGRPGAVFIDVGQAGGTLRGFISALAISTSIALQYGTPLDMLVSKLAGMQFEPYGLTNDPDVRQARSLVDYIFKWMALEYLDPSVHPELGIGEERAAAAEKAAAVGSGDIAPKLAVHAAPKPAAPAQRKDSVKLAPDGKMCDVCGSIMQRTGACFTCPACGTSSGGCG